MPPEFSIDADSVDVGQIMSQIRARIRDKRGVDYTEEEIRQLASVKLEQFLDPTRVRSELLTYYRQMRSSPSAAASAIPPAPPNYAFEADTAYLSSRGAAGRTLQLVRRLLNPLLKLFINPNPIVHVLHMQSDINAQSSVRMDTLLEQWQRSEHLNYEVMHNLVVEMTRLSIEVKNLKMRVESLSSRLDFGDRRARALESVVQYRPGMGPGAEIPPEAPAAQPPRTTTGIPRGREGDPPVAGGPIKGEAQRARRRRRRRGRGTADAQPGPGGDPLRGDAGAQQEPRPAPERQEAVAGGRDSSLPFERDAPVSTDPPPEPSGDQTDQ